MSNLLNKSTKAKSGFYVVGEGNDGTGKSTQVELLGKYIEKEFGLEVFIAHEPAGCPIADAIRDVIKNGELERSAITNLLLFTASRYEIWTQQALPVLKRGGVVLSARNYLSSVVYQGFAEGLGVDYVRQITAAFMDPRYMRPDVTAVFTLDNGSRQSRLKARGAVVKKDAFESRGGDFQDKLNEGYGQLIDQEEVFEIDASRTIEQVQRNFRKLVVGRMVEKGLE